MKLANLMKLINDKKLLIKIMYAALLSAAILSLGCVAYIYKVSTHIKTVMDGHIGHGSFRSLPGYSELEKDSRVRASDLSKYLLYSDWDINSGDWLEFHSDKLFKNLSNYIVSETIQLPQPVVNDCEEIYCFQYRVSFGEIPSLLWRGLIGIEDTRFVHHAGVDLKSIARALVTDIKEMRFAQGGSTITQQLVKNLFFSNERKLIRKVKEAIYAIYLESQYSKDQILNAYFNEVYWGTISGIKVKGFYSASLAYFSKRPQELDEYEVSILVSMLKGPSYYSPVFHPERLKERAKVVYNKLKELNFIVEENSMWTDSKFDRWVKNVKNSHQGRWVRDIFKMSVSNEKIYDFFEYYIFMRSITKTVGLIEERIEGKDIAVKAIVKELNCKEKCKSFTYYSKLERDKGVAISDERHQVGSILKPIFYQIILNNGVSLTDTVSTEPITLDLKSGKWTPKNSSKTKTEEITVLDALRKSRNIPLIRLAQQVGFQKIENEAILYLPQLQLPLAEFPAQMLGAVELSVKDVFETYRQYIQTECQKILDGEYFFENSLMKFLSDHSETTISRLISPYLKDAPFFGKTGTTNNGLDNWYVSFDGKRIYVIWFGLEGSRVEQKLRLSGASASFRIFQDFQIYRGKRFTELGCPENQ